MLLTPLGGSGREDTRENGYDSGNVTGTEDFTVDGPLVFSTALLIELFWISRYESKILKTVLSGFAT